MSKPALEIPEVAVIAVTRGLAGAGIGLLVADKLRAPTRTPKTEQGRKGRQRSAATEHTASVSTTAALALTTEA